VLPKKDTFHLQELVVMEDRFDADIIYSAFVKTIDTANSELAYSEVIDIIPLDTSNVNLPYQQFGNIYFDFDKYFLRSESKNLMDNLFQYLADHPEATLEIGGHTDWFGTNKYNMKLSKNRMRSAKKHLVAQGLYDQRITKKFYREEKPTGRNDNANESDNIVNRQTKRRVEFRINCGNDTTFLIEVN
jgi:outer membrane protein OmpA-like peptidoglycan-associated protein